MRQSHIRSWLGGGLRRLESWTGLITRRLGLALAVTRRRLALGRGLRRLGLNQRERYTGWRFATYKKKTNQQLQSYRSFMKKNSWAWWNGGIEVKVKTGKKIVLKYASNNSSISIFGSIRSYPKTARDARARPDTERSRSWSRSRAEAACRQRVGSTLDLKSGILVLVVFESVSMVSIKLLIVDCFLEEMQGFWWNFGCFSTTTCLLWSRQKCRLLLIGEIPAIRLVWELIFETLCLLIHAYLDFLSLDMNCAESKKSPEVMNKFNSIEAFYHILNLLSNLQNPGNNDSDKALIVRTYLKTS